MPLDLEALKNQSEQQTKDLIAGQGTSLESSLQGIAAKARARRGGFLNNPLIASTLAQFGVQATPGAVDLGNRNLEQSLQSNINQGRVQARAQNIGLGLQNQSRVVGEGNQSLLEQQGFANTNAAQVQAQQFQAQQAEKDRENQIAIDNLKQYYSDQGAQVQQQYAPDPSDQYQQALSRAFSTLVGVGASYGINKGLMKNYQNNLMDGNFTPAPSEYNLPIGPAPMPQNYNYPAIYPQATGGIGR